MNEFKKKYWTVGDALSLLQRYLTRGRDFSETLLLVQVKTGLDLSGMVSFEDFAKIDDELREWNERFKRVFGKPLYKFKVIRHGTHFIREKVWNMLLYHLYLMARSESSKNVFEEIKTEVEKSKNRFKDKRKDKRIVRGG